MTPSNTVESPVVSVAMRYTTVLPSQVFLLVSEGLTTFTTPSYT
jgi:hypothetical protein